MRKDIHCASGAEAQPTLDSLGNPTGTGYTLQLSVSQGQCQGVTNLSNGVQWCSVSVGGSTNRYAVYRTISGNCGAADARFQVDYITSLGGSHRRQHLVAPGLLDRPAPGRHGRTCPSTRIQ